MRPLSCLIGFALCLAVFCEEETAQSEEEQRYVPYTPKSAHFSESFDDWSRWKHSANPKFEGKFEVGSGPQDSLPGSVGLLVPAEAKSYAISAPFESVFDVKDSDLVIQYELRLHDQLQCGGAYIKVLRETDAEFDAEEFSNDSPYTIMFGPDRCGETNKVHFIFQYQNPVTGEWTEHHLANPPIIKNDRRTHLYTLIIRRDNAFDLQIDGETEKSGSLLEDFTPPVNPPEEIDDPEDSKPEDWVDEQMIPDPEDEKPEDWDEDAPQMIVDEEADKPDDWYEEESYLIPDPEASEPDDWDAEFDGDWEAPEIDNPKCQGASGCGPWKKPVIPNPDYKGPWAPKMIENPAYKGEWSPRQIKNEAYFVTTDPHSKLHPMVGVGIDIWTMQANIEFDNIYIGRSVDDAEDFAANTFEKKQKYEEEHMPKPDIAEPKSDDILAQITEFISQNYVAVSVVSIVGVLSLLFFVCLRGSDSTETRESERSEEAEASEDEKEDEDASGGETSAREKSPQIEEVDSESEEESGTEEEEVAGAKKDEKNSSSNSSSSSNGVSVDSRTKKQSSQPAGQADEEDEFLNFEITGDSVAQTPEDDEAPALVGTSSTGLEEEEEADRVRQRRKSRKPRRT